MNSNGLITGNMVWCWLVSETLTIVKGIGALTYVSDRLVIRNQRNKPLDHTYPLPHQEI